MSSNYTTTQIRRAKRTISRAESWRSANPQAWACIVGHALDLAAEGQPIAAQALIESIRKKSFVDRFGKDTRTNNSYASVFARWLWIEHPSARPYIELRKCAIGEVFGL